MIGAALSDYLAIAELGVLFAVPCVAVFALVNWLILRRAGVASLALWSLLVGAYLSSIVYFDWFDELDSRQWPLWLPSSIVATLEAALLLIIPSMLGVAVVWTARSTGAASVASRRTSA
jgi:hypothetical protein